MRENIIDNVKDYLIAKYDCHAIILYGSFANETFKAAYAPHSPFEKTEELIDFIKFLK